MPNAYLLYWVIFKDENDDNKKELTFIEGNFLPASVLYLFNSFKSHKPRRQHCYNPILQMRKSRLRDEMG